MPRRRRARRSRDRAAIANPDLVRRWYQDPPLNEPDTSTFDTEGLPGTATYLFI